jgi:hypothetical protein
MEEKTATASTGRAPGCIVCETVMPFLERCWSDATRDHFRTSRVEFLKGIRSLLDTRIAHLSKEHARGTHVVVE